MSTYATTPCSSWGSLVNGTMSDFGLANAGEFSLAVTDCGKYLNGVNLGTRYEGNYTGYSTPVGSCTEWIDYQSWDTGMKNDMKQFSLASMDALQVGLLLFVSCLRLINFYPRTGSSGHGK